MKKRKETGNRLLYYTDKGLSRGLTHNMIASIEFKINEDHSIKTSYIFNFSDEDSLIDLSAESQLTDYLGLVYGYQRLNGYAASFFGQWDNNDRVYVNLSLKF
ncbi:MAG: hypothetical protein GY699_10955 [Desulfobacteraceae bacterium]|nr:hypothetical protein [Desulfobacteraceae bacterium]